MSIKKYYFVQKKTFTILKKGVKIRKTNHGLGKHGSISGKSLLEKKCGLLQKNHQMQTGNMELSSWEKVGKKVAFSWYVFHCFESVDFNTAENITESLVSEGLVSVRKESARNSPEVQRLIELEDAARAAGKGKWGTSASSVLFIKFYLLRFSLTISF